MASQADKSKKTSASTTSGRQKARVFIEGREVPFVQASVVFKMNMPAMANIELVPLSVIKFIKPRSQIHLFVQDPLTFGDNQFYLCFEGEVMGRSMIKRHDGRAFRITAYDYTNYWDDTKAFIMNPNFLAGRMADAVLYGEPPPGQQAKAEAGKAMPTAANTNSLMVDFLVKYKNADGTPDVIKGVMEVARQLALVNEFFRAAYERLRILDRMDLRSSGRLQDFLKSLKIHEFLSSYTGQQGGMVTLRQMLMGILTLFFHESMTVPFPSYIQKDSKTTGLTIKQFLFIPDMYLTSPPKCNVFFPNQQTGFEFDEDFKSAPTRYGFRNSFPLIAGNESTLVTYPIQYYPPSFSDYMTRGKSATDSDVNSALGPSKLIKSKDGRSYGELFYSSKSSGKAIGTSYSTVLREADYLSTEESIKGIFYDSDVLAPAYSSLVRTGQTKADERGREIPIEATNATQRNTFMNQIGKYLFFKKRYSARNVQASIGFNPFAVPGFNALFLDDSDAGQSFVAKLQSITHNFTHQGFTSVCELAYARDFDEVDLVSGGTGDPPLPGWFDPALYGATDTTKKFFNMETDFLIQSQVFEKNSDEAVYRKTDVKNPTVFTEMSQVYQQLLGCDAVTGLGPAPTKAGEKRQALVTTRGATQYLVNQYISKGNQPARDEYARSYIRRPVTTMQEAFNFIGAEPAESTSSSVIPEEFAKFVAITDPKKTGLPGRFDGKGYSDENVLQVRRNILDTYINQLQNRRGFRG